MDCNTTCPHSGDLAALKTTDTFLMREMKDIKQSVTNNHIETKEMINGLSDQINGLDKKFAPKWVEVAIKGAIGLIVGGIIIAGLNSLMK